MNDQLEIERFEGEGGPACDDVVDATDPGAIVGDEPIRTFDIREGTVVDATDRRYVIDYLRGNRCTLRRLMPKLRGKAARRQDKADRRRARGARA